MKNRGDTKIIKSLKGGVTKLLNIPVIAVAVFQNFRATRVEVTVLFNILICSAPLLKKTLYLVS